MKIALDLEAVLARTREPVLRSTDRLDREDVSGKWFDNDDGYVYQIYMGVSDAIWRHNADMIPPEEPAIAEHVAELREQHTVDILTHRCHVDEQIVWWLGKHNVHYDELIATDAPKWEFDYDVYVDDNPEMVARCRLLLRNQPWNSHVACEDSCERIFSLGEVSGRL